MDSTAAVAVRSHPGCLDHLPSLGHPETPGRLRVVLDELEGAQRAFVLDREAEPASDEDTLGVIRWLHDAAYIARFRATCERAPALLDSPDNPVSRGSFRAALTAAGLTVRAALDLVNGKLRRGFLAVRPPGHHALPDRAMGFCFFNNVALAAEIVVRALQEPVLIVDFDVHHGNGTQAMFYDRPDVGYLSVHRYPFFPGTGAADETGTGRGLGTTRNVPLAVGADDAVYATAVEDALAELGGRLRPAAVLVSAGFDAHAEDPLGGMRVTEAGFARITRAIVQAAETWAEGRVLSVLEGGYHPRALARSVRAHVTAVAGDVEAARKPSADPVN